MAQYIGHEDCFRVLEDMLRAFELGGYKRLVTYRPGESVLFDSNPAPGYVPGVKGKKETGVEYTPKVDGTRIHIYYVAGQKADARAVEEAKRATKFGYDAHEILGTLVSIRRLKDGSVQLQFVAGNRDVIEGGKVTAKVPLRSVSVTPTPSAKGGLIVAMSFEQSLGIPYHMLKTLLESEAIENDVDIHRFSKELRKLHEGIDAGIPPAAKPAEEKPKALSEGDASDGDDGATGAVEGVK